MTSIITTNKPPQQRRRLTANDILAVSRKLIEVPLPECATDEEIASGNIPCVMLRPPSAATILGLQALSDEAKVQGMSQLIQNAAVWEDGEPLWPEGIGEIGKIDIRIWTRLIKAANDLTNTAQQVLDGKKGSDQGNASGEALSVQPSGASPTS